jgi:hypothetical protein
MLARQRELMREVDEKTGESNLREARAWLGLLDGVDYVQHSRRVLVAAQARRKVSLREPQEISVAVLVTDFLASQVWITGERSGVRCAPSVLVAQPFDCLFDLDGACHSSFSPAT